MPTTDRPLVIYHGNCYDGLTAAWAAWRKFGANADYQAALYGEPLPSAAWDRPLYILDFSYPRAELEARALDPSHVLNLTALRVLDHHKTAEADLAGLPFCTFDLDSTVHPPPPQRRRWGRRPPKRGGAVGGGGRGGRRRPGAFTKGVVMGNLKRWRQVGGSGGGSMHKWDGTPIEFEGVWRGFHDGKYGPLGTLETSEGTITLPMPTVLYERCRHVKEGADLKIEYKGKATGKKSGKEYHDFLVFVGSDDDLTDGDTEPPF